MSKLYRDYFWKNGIPYGKGSEEEAVETYKIAMDPYRKRISIEKYEKGQFTSLIYDSALFDFRHLKPDAQYAWQKTVIRETAEAMECLLRNQDDRIVVREVYRFDNNVCRSCEAFSVHGVPISRQRMFYTALGDPFNGVILYDLNEHQVLSKRYNVDQVTGEFTDLLEESWNCQNAKTHALR